MDDKSSRTHTHRHWKARVSTLKSSPKLLTRLAKLPQKARRDRQISLSASYSTNQLPLLIKIGNISANQLSFSLLKCQKKRIRWLPACNFALKGDGNMKIKQFKVFGASQAALLSGGDTAELISSSSDRSTAQRVRPVHSFASLGLNFLRRLHQMDVPRNPEDLEEGSIWTRRTREERRSSSDREKTDCVGWTRRPH